MSEGTRGPKPASPTPPSGARPPERTANGSNGSNGPRATTATGRSVPWEKAPTPKSNGSTERRSGVPEFTPPAPAPVADKVAEPPVAAPGRAPSGAPAAKKPPLRNRLGLAKKDENDAPQPVRDSSTSTPTSAAAVAEVATGTTHQPAGAAAFVPGVQERQVPPDELPAIRPIGTPAAVPGQSVSADTVVIPTPGSVGPAVEAPASAAAPVPAATQQHATAAKPKVGAAHRTRKARLRLSRLDPWSVMKTSFLFSIAAGIMLVVAVYVVWTVIGASSLFDSVNDIVKSVVSTPGDTTPFRIQEYINTQKVMGVAALLACVDVVIFTALATLGSFLYNLAATMLGGLEITLAED